MTIETIFQIFIEAVAATSLMTLFSYAVSAAAREVYKEPLLLTYVMSFLRIEVSLNVKSILAWVVHYLIGILFVIGYHVIWNNDIMEISWLTALILGICIGSIGIAGWMILFSLVPKKPAIDYKGYYIQLFIAHLIFSATAFKVYLLFNWP
ncbi:hypothetical protein K6T82_05670 [Flavobacterium sp. 17A]|uniref:Uncharacterized protein n=1 Tax=Flavobacterium potami TaxID=2872310 RepID=A0A9X1H8R4_9FLAO|nr:hypothetical protein [Flavobacterium potami]MBZ4034245.1 hypothetical protein [Flavobacterium potami]